MESLHKLMRHESLINENRHIVFFYNSETDIMSMGAISQSSLNQVEKLLSYEIEILFRHTLKR